MTLRQLLFEPTAFFERNSEPQVGPAIAVLALCTLSLASLLVPLAVVITAGKDLGIAESFPTVEYVAGQARLVLDGGSIGAITLVFLAPIPILVGYALAFHALSWPFADRGSLRETVRTVAWGSVPLAGASALTLLAIAISVPSTVDQLGYAYVTTTGRTIAQHADPNTLFLLCNVVGIAFVCWAGVLWVTGIAAVRGLSRRQAALVVGPLLALGLANALPSVLYGVL